MGSPWETATDNASATATVTVPVETRTLTPEEIQLDGTWTLGDTRSLSLTANGEDAAKQIVTATPKVAGDVMPAGDLMVELSGRPLIGLDIPFDLYRDIAPGDGGRDVKVIQTALADLGLYRGAVDGTYGSLTAESRPRALPTRRGDRSHSGTANSKTPSPPRRPP